MAKWHYWTVVAFAVLFITVTPSVSADGFPTDEQIIGTVNYYWGEPASPEVHGYYIYQIRQNGWTIGQVVTHILGPAHAYLNSQNSEKPNQVIVYLRVWDDRKDPQLGPIQIQASTGSGPTTLPLGGGTMIMWTNKGTSATVALSFSRFDNKGNIIQSVIEIPTDSKKASGGRLEIIIS